MALSSATLFSISSKRFCSASGMMRSYFSRRSRSTTNCQPRSSGGNADHSLVDRSELARIGRQSEPARKSSVSVVASGNRSNRMRRKSRANRSRKYYTGFLYCLKCFEPKATKRGKCRKRIKPLSMLMKAAMAKGGSKEQKVRFTISSPPKWWVATVLPRALRFKRPLHRCNACNPTATRRRS